MCQYCENSSSTLAFWNESEPPRFSLSARYRVIAVSCVRSVPAPSTSTSAGVLPKFIVGLTSPHRSYPTTSNAYGTFAYASINLMTSALFLIGMYDNQYSQSSTPRAPLHRSTPRTEVFHSVPCS